MSGVKVNFPMRTRPEHQLNAPTGEGAHARAYCAPSMDQPHISVVVPENTNTVHSVLIQWRPGDVGELHAELRIRTDSPKFPVILLPISGIAQ